MSDQYTFDDWMTINVNEINEIYNIVLRTLHYDTNTYYPIESLHINHTNLYNDIAKYLYATSNNTNKNYILRNIQDY